MTTCPGVLGRGVVAGTVLHPIPSGFDSPPVQSKRTPDRKAGRVARTVLHSSYYLHDAREATVDRKCIDLKERFGRRYRIGYDESYHAEHGLNARIHDPWLMIVVCKFGRIFPHGGTTLAASVDGYPKVAGRLRRLSCCRVHQDGDFGELTVVFHVADFPKVAKILRPRRRRQVSPRERERLRAMGFKKGSQPHVDVQYSGRACNPGPQGDSEPVRRQLALFADVESV